MAGGEYVVEIRDQAKLDWQKGKKYQYIADKYGVSLSTVKSWATRYWKPEKVATKNIKKLQPKKTEKLQPETTDDTPTTPKPRGAPPGNKNAVGNPGGGAPEGNKNNHKHGLYETVYWDTLDDTELDMIRNLEFEKQEQLIDQIKLLSVRERRLLLAIKEYKEKANGLTLDSVIRRRSDTDGSLISKSNKVSHTETVTKTISTFDVLMRLESELTRVQRAKTRCLESLSRLHIAEERLKLLRENGDMEFEDTSETDEAIYGTENNG